MKNKKVARISTVLLFMCTGNAKNLTKIQKITRNFKKDIENLGKEDYYNLQGFKIIAGWEYRLLF